jgi:hypothetical protein
MVTKSIKKTIAKSAEGYPLLGYAVYWSISNVRILQTDFVKMLEKLQIPLTVAPEIRPKTALTQAIRSNVKGKGDLFHRNVLNDDKHSGIVIARQAETDDQMDVQFDMDTKVLYDKRTKLVEIRGNNKDEIQKSFDEFKQLYTSDRFRTVVLRVIKSYCEGVAIREKGGVYFVPSTHNDNFAKLEKLFSNFPTCSLDIIPVIDTKQAKKSMWKSLVGEVTEELARFQEDLQKLSGDLSEYSIQTRLNRYKKLKAKVESYEILLSGTASDLKKELDGLTSAILKNFA